jgi:hypothetical protein
VGSPQRRERRLEDARVPFVIRDHLLQSAPAVFFLTDHYQGYPTVLVRLAALDRAHLGELLEEAWRQAAPKHLVQAYDARAVPSNFTAITTAA